jgi:hypothetical protein
MRNWRRSSRAILDAWLEFRRRVGTLDGASLAAPVTGLLDEVGNTVLAINGADRRRTAREAPR